ncbi:diguanylate cyclase domain-containing protein [Chitinimonas koreensis]|uniref:diguanylate cyclase domain-containing protein n=1 Tax=Chitinimonas koreensis TaxID=356302 RepID=UPI00041FEF3A|nr:diguanylate cyclase [Chitinimonas koreensis]QNM97966.1 diguanylate cyclase [Chitinimonas koreensis]
MSKNNLAAGAPPDCEQRFRALADAMPQIVWTARPDGHIDYVNQRWQAYTGRPALSPDEPDWPAALHPDDVAAWRSAWAQAVAGGKGRELELRLLGADGHARWHLHRLVPIQAADGAVLRWFGTSTDIHEQRSGEAGLDRQLLDERAAGALALNEHLLGVMAERRSAMLRLQQHTEHLNQVIVTQSHLAQAELELEGFMVIVVERMLALTPATGAVVELADGDEMVYRAASGSVQPYVGIRLKIDGSLSGLCVKSGEMLDCPDSSIDPRVDAAACRKVGAASMIVTPLIERGTVVGVLKILSSQPHAFSQSDRQTLQLMAGLIGAAIGHQQHFETSQRLLAERTEALTALAQEVERRRLSEQTLRTSEARIRLIIESSGEAFVATDDDGRVTDWNRQAERLFGWARDEMLGRELAAMLVPEHAQAAYADGLARLRRDGQDAVLRLDLQAQTRERGEIQVEMTITAIKSGSQCLFSAFLRDVSAQRQHEARLRHQAEHDALTGLPNRRAFMALLEDGLAQARRPQAVLFLDLDGFKAVNDQHGHESGDELLRQFAARIRSCVRDSDVVARLGGDEFVLLLRGLNDGATDAERVARQIIGRMADPFELTGTTVGVTTSVGVALHRPGDQATPDALLQRADAAMYIAKRAGKNQFWLAPG